MMIFSSHLSAHRLDHGNDEQLGMLYKKQNNLYRICHHLAYDRRHCTIHTAVPLHILYSLCQCCHCIMYHCTIVATTLAIIPLQILYHSTHCTTVAIMPLLSLCHCTHCKNFTPVATVPVRYCHCTSVVTVHCPHLHQFNCHSLRLTKFSQKSQRKAT